MSHNRVLKYTLFAFATVGGIQSAHAQALQQQAAAPASNAAVISVPASTQALPCDTSATVQSTADDLQQQIQAHSLTEMRTAYNGSYGASLLFNIKEGNYYVALFQQKAFWRVIKTSNAESAEAIYADFSRQAATLAASELQAARLQSQRAMTDQQIAVVQERAARLQADVSIARLQQAAVTAHQREIHDENAALKAQQTQLQAQLHQLEEQVRTLQRQANAGLPSNIK